MNKPLEETQGQRTDQAGDNPNDEIPQFVWEPFYRGKPLSQWVHGLEDPAESVRRETVEALTQIGPVAQISPATLPGLHELFKDKDAKLRLAAAIAIWRIARQGDTPAQVLSELLKD